MYCIGISICISVCTVYRYLVSRYVYSVSKYIQIQSAGADNRQMIKPETDTVMTGSQDGHDEHTQKGARRAQKAFEGERLRYSHIYARQKEIQGKEGYRMPRGGKRMPSYRDIAEAMDGDELDAILDVSLQGLARAREKGSQPMYSNSPEGLKSFKHDSEEYLTFVRNVNKTPTEGGKLRLVPDIESWAAFLGVTRHMITGYEKRGSDWKSTIDAVKGVITACKKQLAFIGKMPPVLAIFDLTNNSGYVNASEFRLSAEAAPEAKQITAEEWEKVIDAEPEAPKLSDFKLSDDLN